MSVEKELRIMHACELGAVGVYRGLATVRPNQGNSIGRTVA